MNTDRCSDPLCWCREVEPPKPQFSIFVGENGQAIFTGSMIQCAAKANRLANNGCKNISILQV